MSFIVPPPPFGLYRYSYRITVDNVPFRFLFRYNPRDVSWYLDLGDASGVALVRGIRLVIGTDLLRAHKTRRIPQGSLDVVDKSGDSIESGKDDLGGRVVVTYTEAS